jgi:tetratricopeptide (TPR) repeat protein
MQLKLAGDERGITKKYTSSNEAYQLYMKGRYHWSRRTKDDLLKAIDNYKEAIALDPNFALAYAATAEVYNSMGKIPMRRRKIASRLRSRPPFTRSRSIHASAGTLCFGRLSGSLRLGLGRVRTSFQKGCRT